VTGRAPLEILSPLFSPIKPAMVFFSFGEEFTVELMTKSLIWDVFCSYVPGIGHWMSLILNDFMKMSTLLPWLGSFLA
jgi:hypothetical protein